jgi:large subunit ribosomal protein L15
MDLSQVSHGVARRRPKKRVGRGIGSGHGKTASRGSKGQYASAGANLPGALFTGGQTPIHRRFPKRGFSNATWAKEYAEVNVGDLDRFDAGGTVDLSALKARRVLNGTWDGLRVLGNGELTKKLTIRVHAISAAARTKVEAAGGSVELLRTPKRPAGQRPARANARSREDS